MIIPMRKYAFIVHPQDYDAFLEELRALGVLHVKPAQETAPLEIPGELADLLEEAKDAIHFLGGRSRKAVACNGSAYPGIGDPKVLARLVVDTKDALDNARQHAHMLQREMHLIEPWGHFSLETLRRIEGSGWACSFYSCPARKFQPEWQEEHFLFIVREMSAEVWFVAFYPIGTPPALPIDRQPTPAHDLQGLQQDLRKTEVQISALEAELDRLAAGLPALQSYYAGLLEAQDREILSRQTEKAAGEAVLVLEGFVPHPVEDKLEGAFAGRPVIYWAENPIPEDAPPVLLKNNRFSRLFEPISKLYALPAYQELDLTPFFAPFFMLFFGFCLGDAGYGVAILLGALFFRRKAGAAIKPLLDLAAFLGIATILLGALTGTVFGVNLLEGNHEWLGNARKWMINSNQAFNLALALGFVQTIYGLVIKAVNKARQFGWQYGMPSAGWILLLLSLADLALLKATGKISAFAAYAGIALILLFSDPKAGIMGRIGKGLWELYGITGFFGDLLSYIRLFALGVSSAVLGFVINDIALQIKGAGPVIGPVLFIVFLLIGHTVNLAIASLGAFVHPMRLTFVEFYKNAGFSGGGKPYTPFASRKIHTDNNPQNA